MSGRIWTSQPPVGVGANQKWINRGLVALFDVRQARELISGDFATNKTNLVVSTSGGIAGDFSGVANQQYAHRPAYAITGDISVVIVCDIDALTNYTHFISKQGTTTTNAPYEVRLGGVAGTDGKASFLRANGSGFAMRFSASNVVSAPVTNASLIFTKKTPMEGVDVLYYNGIVSDISNLSNTKTGTPTDNGSAVWIGRRYDGVTQLDGRIYYIALFNVAIPDSEAAELSGLTSRWDIYAPQKINNYIGAVSTTTHGCTGVLAGAGATIAGVAEHKVKHSSSGALAGAGATIAGVAVRKAKHICTAVIAGIGAEVAGVANRVGGATTHSSSGALGGTGATVAGVAQHYPKHVCTGALAGAGATVAGVARHVAHHVASGVLAGAGAVIVGAASRPYVENLLLTPLEADGDLVNNEWLARQLRALGGNIQANVGAMPDFNSANQQIVSIGKTPAEVKGAALNKESTYKKLK